MQQASAIFHRLHIPSSGVLQPQFRGSVPSWWPSHGLVPPGGFQSDAPVYLASVNADFDRRQAVVKAYAVRAQDRLSDANVTANFADVSVTFRLNLCRLIETDGALHIYECRID